MNAIEAIKSNMATAELISLAYLEDLSDVEMMHRPDPACNHIKWQMGHLLGSDNQMINGCCPDAIAPLSVEFVEKYTKEQAASDDPADFDTKQALLDVYQSQKKAILGVLATLSESDLDKPTMESIRAYAPTVGAAFNMIGLHWTMHAGQWAVIRRQLGRAPLF